MFMVLIALWWWSEALRDGGDRLDWLKAVDDVSWCFEIMTALPDDACGDKRKCSSGSRPAKRLRS
jgi:hypothetical protein